VQPLRATLIIRKKKVIRELRKHFMFLEDSFKKINVWLGSVISEGEEESSEIRQVIA
jgi:hypothetical protein